MTSLRDRKKQAKLHRIKEAAWVLFTENGFSGTTTRAICQRAEIGTGTLFSYVDDKAELLVLCFGDRVMPILAQAVSTTPQGRVEQRLEHVFGQLMAFYAADLRLGRTILKNILLVQGKGRDHLAAMNFQLQLHTAQLLADGQRDGELATNAPIPLLSGLVFGAYIAVLIALLDGQLPDVSTARMAFSLAVQTAFDGSRPPPPRGDE